MTSSSPVDGGLKTDLLIVNGCVLATIYVGAEFLGGLKRFPRVMEDAFSNSG